MLGLMLFSRTEIGIIELVAFILDALDLSNTSRGPYITNVFFFFIEVRGLVSVTIYKSLIEMFINS